MTELATGKPKEASVHVLKLSHDNDCRQDVKCLFIVNRSWPQEYFTTKKKTSGILAFNKQYL